MNPMTKVLTRKQREKKWRDQELLENELLEIQLLEKQLLENKLIEKELLEKELLQKELLEKLTSVKMDEELLVNLEEKVLEAEVCIMKAGELKLKTERMQTRKEGREGKISKLIEVGEREVLTFKAGYCSKDDLKVLEYLECLKTSGYTEQLNKLSQTLKMQCAKKEKVMKEYVKLDGRIVGVQELLRKALLGEGVCRNPKCQEASLHRCSGCLLVSYCSLQCSHLCWKKHRQICTREQTARNIRKKQRMEERNMKAKRKSEKVVDKEASKVMYNVHD